MRLGVFHVQERIGAGGMGEVYRARDTTLGRDVAIKILTASFLSEPARLARFEREAKVLAALNHPLIAQIYGLEQSGDTRAIVMELVEGPTIEDRLARGPIPVPQALHIARQLAEALEAAHDLGFVHRDLKPSNVKLVLREPDDLDHCAVKVLDFGLAKGVEPTSNGDPENSPTLTHAQTEFGVILGTAAYMAPEQARGRAVDKRADVWAFGVVLYEMLTGTRLFKRESVPDTLAAVLREPIVFSSLPAETPAAVSALLERCLERDPRQRLRDIGEARVSLERALASPAADKSTDASAHPTASRVRTLVPWALFAGTAVALAGVLIPARSETPARPAGVTRVTASIGVPGALAIDAGPAVVLSPDGRAIAMNVRHDGTTRLFVRRMDQSAPTPLAGTEQAVNPFFSPDGAQIGFFASGGLKILPLAGGAATTLTDAATGRGAAWDTNGDILFQPSILTKTPMVRITSTGARRDRGTTLAAEEATHRWPQFLPGGRVLYTGNADVSNWDGGTLRIETTPGAPGKILLKGAYHGRYVPTGHLLYVYGGKLYGVRFDLQRLEVTSPPVGVVDSITSTHISGSAQYSVSSDGTLAYVAGSQASADGRLHWMNTRGDTSALKIAPGAWGNPRFSPDGTRIAMQVTRGSHEQLAVYEIGTDRLTPITADAANHSFPAWTPDGRGIVYTSDASGSGSENLYWRRADGSGDAVRLTTSPLRQTDASMDPRGRFIVYAELDGQGQATLHVLPIQSTGTGLTAGTPRPLKKDGSFEGLAAISPDGRLVAYMGMPPGAPGSFAIYVKPLDSDGGPWRVSTSNGAHPVWSKTARELLFTTEDQIMTAAYKYDGGEFRVETPRPWSGVRYVTGGPTRKYDLHPDGTRVVVGSPDATDATVYDKVTFVFNFFEELERLLPRGR